MSDAFCLAKCTWNRDSTKIKNGEGGKNANAGAKDGKKIKTRKKNLKRLELGALLHVGPAVLANHVASDLFHALCALLARLADHLAA